MSLVEQKIANYIRVTVSNYSRKGEASNYSCFALCLLQVALNMLETERNYRVAKIVQKTSVITLSAESADATYKEFLTPYAFRYVQYL